jgi:uncharacterized protein
MPFPRTSRNGVHLLNPIVRTAASTVTGFALFAGVAGHAQATSFPCHPNQSSSEDLICEDAELSSLDDKLSALYNRAKDLAPDRAAIEADRISQWEWRQRHCADKACVANWYDRRITEIDADIQQGQQAQILTLKAGLTAQALPADAQEAVLEIKGVYPPAVGDR